MRYYDDHDNGMERPEDHTDADGTRWTWSATRAGYDITHPDGSRSLWDDALSRYIDYRADGAPAESSTVVHRSVEYIPTSLTAGEYFGQADAFGAAWNSDLPIRRPGSEERPARRSLLDRLLGRRR